MNILLPFIFDTSGFKDTSDENKTLKPTLANKNVKKKRECE